MSRLVESPGLQVAMVDLLERRGYYFVGSESEAKVAQEVAHGNGMQCAIRRSKRGFEVRRTAFLRWDEDGNATAYADRERTQPIAAAESGKLPGCGVGNGAVGARDKTGLWWGFDSIDAMPDAEIEFLFGEYPKIIRVVLTTAHLDHDPANCALDNLRYWCQLHHLRYDAPRKARERRERNKRAAGEQPLPLEVR